MADVDPDARTLALVMLLAGAVLGFLLGWCMRDAKAKYEEGFRQIKSWQPDKNTANSSEVPPWS